MRVLTPVLVAAALASTLALAGCAPTATSGGAPSASATPPVVSGKSNSGTSLGLVDVCSKISPASMASLLGRPYAEIDNRIHTATARGCDYDGTGGDASLLDLNVSMQTGASKADVDKILANLANDGEHAIPINGLGEYAGAVKDVVVALYGTALFVATDSNHPSGTTDLTTAQLRQVVKALVAAAS